MISSATRSRLLVVAIAIPTAWLFWFLPPIGWGGIGWAGEFLSFVVSATPVLACAITLLTCLAALWRFRRRHRTILLVTIPIIMLYQLAWLLFELVHPPWSYLRTAEEVASARHELEAWEASLAIFAVCLYPLIRSWRWLPPREGKQ